MNPSPPDDDPPLTTTSSAPPSPDVDGFDAPEEVPEELPEEVGEAGPAGVPDEPDLTRYLAFLGDEVEAGADLHEAEHLRVGDWRFYYRDEGRRRSLAVAIDGEGRTVVAGGWGAWYELLASADLDDRGALERIAWLLGRAAPIAGDDPVEDGAGLLVGEPELAVDDDLARFTGWVVYPPNTSSPVRLSVEARPDETATLISEPWQDIE